MKKLLLLLALSIGTFTINAQTKEELKAQKAEKQAEADKFQAEANALQAQIDALPGWRTGAFGTIGGSYSEFSNWYTQDAPNNSSANLGFTVNGFANLKQEKFFWRNAANINLAWVKLDDKDDPTDSDKFREAQDVFNISSLYGRNISKTFAVSGLAEYRTTILNNFNDPGYLDLGVGATWNPTKNLFVVIHPLNYNFVFSKDDTIFDSSLGAKIVADYTAQIGAISFKSNFSTFQSYKSGDLSNFTWINSFSYTLWNKIGVGFDFGLRSNKQEALNFATSEYNNLTETEQLLTPAPTFGNIDNKLQTYYVFGLSYNL
ncbi:DUF3078 domain-containing protein [Lacinutrix sp. 5H-3-7-4]|uniref:DUF3078 domain-containing protein n=1 Tax=Lacinutrix sp. (strain 5H-3-7-4) TaxID=983544 RepID=UPI00020A3C11|nr:DUF3078 domain-containing protein [Lacinutrix sp. 5H-3-7-4]AEH01018.1 hypothetical protein Lacal_1170 [Lacinutrix sp. 5H-3-7-4]